MIDKNNYFGGKRVPLQAWQVSWPNMYVCIYKHPWIVYSHTQMCLTSTVELTCQWLVDDSMELMSIKTAKLPAGQKLF